MGLHLTPAMMEQAWEFFRVTPPFNRWNLPHADEVKFRVTQHRDRSGQYHYSDGTIDISNAKHGHTNSFIVTMAHEMVHYHLARKGVRTDHGAEFQRCAAMVCKHHGFDPQAF